MKQTAQGLAALGRGPDTELVHMTKGEVAGLQSLAHAHGGSLTVNPDTGLPEAGILSAILPMVVGAALGPAGFALMSSTMAGLTVGGIATLASGSLSKGLMAGLGAYGGAGLAEGLAGAGTGAISSAGAGAGAQAPLGAIVPEAVLPAATAAAPTATAATAGADVLGGTASELASAYGYPVPPASLAGQGVVTTTPAPVIAAAPTGPVPTGPVPTGPVPTLSPTGDFARFDRMTSPGLGASNMDRIGAGVQSATASPSAAWEFAKANKFPLGAMGLSALMGMEPDELNAPEASKGMIRPYTYSREKIPGAFEDVAGAPYSSKERRYFTDSYTAGTPYKAPGPEYMAVGGPVEAMSNANALGASTGYPQSDIRTGAYSSPFQQPIGQNVVTGAQDAAVDPYTGQAQFADGGSVGGYTYDQATGQYSGGTPLGNTDNKFLSKMFFSLLNGKGIPNGIGGVVNPAQATNGSIGGYTYDPATQSYTHAAPIPTQATSQGGPVALTNYGGDSGGRANGGLLALAQGGVSDLGGYSDGGRLLRGPGDGVSDSIPAMIGQKQQARLADGEFVVPARIVSELGNGSTEAGARQLYAMMDRVQKNRKKSMGKDKVAADSKSSRLLPA